MGASAEFYALVVAAYSVGEAVGSTALGWLSTLIGVKRTLQLSALLSLSGSLSYALAHAVHVRFGARALGVGPATVLIGRLLQGIGSGGQQAVEQSYLAVAAAPEARTSLTSQLSTFACLGFIFGPAIGATVTQTPEFEWGPLAFDSFTKQGWVVAILNISMLLSTTYAFTEVSARPAHTMRATSAQDARDERTRRADATSGRDERTRRAHTTSRRRRRTSSSFKRARPLLSRARPPSLIARGGDSE